MGQRMAGSGSNSRKGFPEAGGECCQPQGQEEVMYLEGHEVLTPSPWAGHSHGRAQTSLRAGASSAWERVRGSLRMAYRRGEPGCIRTAVTRGLDTVLAATLGTRSELPLPRGSKGSSALPRSHSQEVAKL